MTNFENASSRLNKRHSRPIKALNSLTRTFLNLRVGILVSREFYVLIKVTFDHKRLIMIYFLYFYVPVPELRSHDWSIKFLFS